MQWLTFILLMWRIGRAPNSIPIYSYIQQDATLHSLFISGKIWRRNAAHMGSISLWISFAASILFAHKKRTTPRCSIVVQVFRGAAIF
jgi:hypothetical protein